MIKHSLYSFFTAVRFLTVLPVTLFTDKDSECFTSSLKFFVLIGLLIGCCNLIAVEILAPYLPKPLLVCIVILLLSSVSGFLHMDGLADTADGFFSSRPRQRILEIMHDSRTGAMGIIGLFFILMFKYSSLISLSHVELSSVVFWMPIAGRSAIIMSMQLLPYAREEGGLGSLFYGGKRWNVTLYSSIFFISGLAFTAPVYLMISFITVIVTSVLFSMWCKKKIGGATGDTLGAVCEISEASVAFALAVFVNL